MQNNKDFHIIIPARYQSTRLAGKVLLDIAGKPMIQHVYERAIQSHALTVTVATDHEEVKNVVESFGGRVCMTDIKHPSGTDRIAEVIKLLQLSDDAIVVNLQGDEPLLAPTNINQVANNFSAQQQAVMSSLCESILSVEQLLNPNVVKVVRDSNNNALYFSRAPIPWDQQNFATQEKKITPGQHFRHVGIYAARAGFICNYVQWNKCELEEIESLEQLRIIWRGYKIDVADALERSYVSVDTEEDLKRVKELLQNQSSAVA